MEHLKQDGNFIVDMNIEEALIVNKSNLQKLSGMH